MVLEAYCMYRAQWRQWSGYNTIILNWGVEVSATQRSIMWAELRQDQSTSVWSIYQQGIYTPDAATRWMGGIAMDVNGSIGLSYMKSDASSIYPGLFYSGRRSCDPLGTLPITEVQVVIAGTGYQTGKTGWVTMHRLPWIPTGLLSGIRVNIWEGRAEDPLQLHTNIFLSASKLRKHSDVNIAVTSGSNPTCTGVSITFTAAPTNGGTTPAYQWKVNGTNVGTNSPTYSSSALTNGQVVTCVMTSNFRECQVARQLPTV